MLNNLESMKLCENKSGLVLYYMQIQMAVMHSNS